MDEFNVFANICANPLFGMIVIIIFLAQILMTTFGNHTPLLSLGGLAFGLYSNFGLNVIQWYEWD